jgi:succinyl-CoA synthetase alpha subunit
MRIASDVAQSSSVETTEAVMGTPTNLNTLREYDGLTAEDLSDIGGDDIVLVATASDADSATAAVDEMAERLYSSDTSGEVAESGPSSPKSIRRACADDDLGIALISVPGAYATREAWKSLHEGLHTQIFSDNVSLERELELKTFAHNQGLLLMGPDCGTAILDGVPLGFANEVDSGPIGLVSASGTGLQAVSSRISRLGSGVSQAIGTGGRDLSAEIRGLTTRTAVDRLDSDDATELIVLLSKPPADAAIEAVLDTVADCTTPVLAHFQGVDMNLDGVRTANTLAATADLALEEVGVGTRADSQSDVTVDMDMLESDLRRLPDGRTKVRGLFTGGTLCTEAAFVADRELDDVQSNVGVGDRLDDPLAPEGHAFVDFGTDDLTTGRPHPMIDPTIRNEQLRAALQDSSTGVILLDIVLGYGAHEDPATGIVDVISDVDTDVPVIASVCGTDGDPQGRLKQIRTLAAADVHVAESNAAAARLASRGASMLSGPREGSL